MKRALLLDVIVRQGAAVLELLPGEDEALLIGRDTLLVLDLGFHIVDGVGRLHLEGDRFAREAVMNERRFEARETKQRTEAAEGTSQTTYVLTKICILSSSA